MIVEVNNLMANAISAVVGWFSSITTSTLQITMIITFISITVIYRFLLKPLLGGSASDSVGRAVKKKVDGGKK